MHIGEHLRADGNIAKWSVIRNYGVISTGRNCTKELRQVSFAGNNPYYDIRMWKTDDKGHEYPCKGATLNYDELRELCRKRSLVPLCTAK